MSQLSTSNQKVLACEPDSVSNASKLKRKRGEIGWGYEMQCTHEVNLDYCNCPEEEGESIRGEDAHELEEIEDMEGGRAKKSKTESERRRQENIKEALYKEKTLEVHKYMARWVYESGIPFHAVDNDSFRRLVEAIAKFGPGYQPPSQYQLRVPLLKGEVERTKTRVKVQEKEWERNGCSIMIDAWSDDGKRDMMSVCVNSRSGTTFLVSKEVSLDADLGEFIFEYVDECIENVGVENVVQVVSDNALNNMAVANLLLEKRPQILWTRCAVESLNLMLEDIAKLPLFKNLITKAKSIIVFIYSHRKTLALMRKRTRSNIVRLGVTRFATTFLTLQNLLEKKQELKYMVISEDWENTKWSRSEKGIVAYDILLQERFWNRVAICLKVFTPLVRVLRLVYGDVKPGMGFVYGEVKKAKEEIKEAFKHKEERYKPILAIVDAHGKGCIDTPLHLTAYLLNPYYYFNTHSTWSTDELVNVMNGFFTCVERVYQDLDMQNEVVNVEFVKYRNREGAFGRVVAEKGCEKNNDAYDPVGWWSNYGCHTPNLRKLAMRILSLTTSSSGSERNWSVFEGIHTEKRHRLDVNRKNKLVYVQFNARLMNKKRKSKKVDVLLANESSHAQSWMVDEVSDAENEEAKPRKRVSNVDEVRELEEEEDIVSDGTEDGGDDNDDEEFDFESDKEDDVEDYGNDEMED